MNNITSSGLKSWLSEALRNHTHCKHIEPTRQLEQHVYISLQQFNTLETHSFKSCKVKSPNGIDSHTHSKHEGKIKQNKNSHLKPQRFECIQTRKTDARFQTAKQSIILSTFEEIGFKLLTFWQSLEAGVQQAGSGAIWDITAWNQQTSGSRSFRGSRHPTRISMW